MKNLYVSNNVAERIKLLAKKNSISLKKLLESVGMGSNAMSNMKTSMPKADNLAKIADYLNCSVDYLLGRTDFSNTETSDEEKLINNFRSLNEEGQNFIIQTMDFAQTKYGNKPSQENISSSDYAEIAAEGGSITRGPIRKKPETTL